MRHAALFVFSLAVAASTFGCVPKVDWTPTSPSPKPMVQRPTQAVAVFSQPPPRAYVEVGMFEKRQTRPSTAVTSAGYIADIRTQAAKMGCEGILVRDLTPPAQAGGRPTLVHVQAGCLMFTEYAPPPMAPMPPVQPVSAAPADAMATAAGCGKDTDCKGDRVCVNGQCQTPAPPPTAPTACTKDTDCPSEQICTNGACKEQQQ